MNLLHKITIFLTFISLLSGCQITNQPVDNSTSSSQVNHIVSYEAPKGHLTPEISIARAIKYNFESIKKLISPKFLGDNADNPFKTLKKIQETETKGLATSLKELDFVILYTSLNLSPQQEQNNILTQATAQNIFLATLKAHENALYSRKKLFEYNRLKRQYQNQIASMIKKKQNTSSEEIEYQEQLKENIDKLNNYIQNAEYNINDFYTLTKIDNNKIELEGQNFYEKNTIQPQYDIENYIKTAFDNRLDIKNFQSHSFEEISLALADQDIDFTPAVSGFYIHDTAFDQKLSLNGSNQAEKLLKSLQLYQKSQKKENFLTLEEDFYKAVYWQIQIAFQLAKHISADYDIQLSNLRQLKNDIRKLEKTSKTTHQQRLDLLKAHITLLENENIADQIFAERTITSVALQFYSGLFQINSADLSQNIDDLATTLLKNMQNKPTYSTNSLSSQNWAHQENWLEKLVSEQQKYVPTQLMSKQTIKKTNNHNQHSIMILGSFLDTTTAEKEWLELKKLCPQLEQYNPIYEKTSAAGITLFRMIIKYPTGGFENVCICLRNHDKECLLKD